MKHQLSKGRLGNLIHQRNLFLVLIAALLMITFTQALFTLSRSERIVVVPPDLKQEIWLEQNTVSSAYLEEMALVYASLILESSPESAAYKRDIILRHTSPESYGALKRRLIEDESRLKKEHVTTSFQPNGIKVDSSHLTVDVTGDLLRFVGEKRISQSRDTYQFQFEYKAGRLSIKAFQLIGSDKPIDDTNIQQKG
jgi:conjugal transfer pilus assembly protein TraE